MKNDVKRKMQANDACDYGHSTLMTNFRSEIRKRDRNVTLKSVFGKSLAVAAIVLCARALTLVDPSFRSAESQEEFRDGFDHYYIAEKQRVGFSPLLGSCQPNMKAFPFCVPD
jgi:hypothetical protein